MIDEIEKLKKSMSELNKRISELERDVNNHRIVLSQMYNLLTIMAQAINRQSKVFGNLFSMN